jgi:hypothetical protein
MSLHYCPEDAPSRHEVYISTIEKFIININPIGFNAVPVLDRCSDRIGHPTKVNNYNKCLEYVIFFFNIQTKQNEMRSGSAFIYMVGL